MTPHLLNRPYIGIQIAMEDYEKVKGLLPTPSYQDIIYSRTSQNTILIYAIDGYVTSAKQYKWLSDIKISLKSFFFIRYDEVMEFYITDTTEFNDVIYTLKELQCFFKTVYQNYPTILFPSDKKSLYRHLIIHGKKLRFQGLFTLEAMISAGLIMNKKLESRYTMKELHQKVKAAHLYIMENQKNFKEKLSGYALKRAHRKGAINKNIQQAQITKEKIEKMLKSSNYIKPNGKVNKTALAKDLNMNRRSLDKYFP